MQNFGQTSEAKKYNCKIMIQLGLNASKNYRQDAKFGSVTKINA